MSEELITKYRPQTLAEVVGHKAVVKSIEDVLKRKASKVFLFTGPSGTGKTTLARIIANMVGCAPSDLLEIDAATYSTVEEMRSVTSSLMYKPLGEGAVKAVIVDEFHALSKAAVQALLKILEEPPAWVFWFICTTEASRVPQTIRTRATPYDLKPVSVNDLCHLLDGIAAKEKLKTPEEVIDLCAGEAQGSPRQALAYLALCAGAKDADEASELLQTAVTSKEAVELARALVKRGDWFKVIAPILRDLKETNPESVRHVVRAYVTTMILSTKTGRDLEIGMTILDAFSQPFNSGDGISPVALACGKVLLNDAA